MKERQKGMNGKYAERSMFMKCTKFLVSIIFMLILLFQQTGVAEAKELDITVEEVESVSQLHNKREAINYLTDEEIVEFIRKEMVARQETIEFYYRASKSDADDIGVNEYLLGKAHTWVDEAWQETECPDEGDYLSWQFDEGYINVSWSVAEESYEAKYVIDCSYYTTAEQEAEVDEKLESVLAELGVRNVQYTTYEKIRKIYEYICNNVEYSYVGDESDTAYAALVRGEASDKGNALLLYRMLEECGIDARLVRANDDGVRRLYNICQVDDKYYFLDSWADADKLIYEYFLKGTNDFYLYAYSTSEYLNDYNLSSDNYLPEETIIVASGNYENNLKWELDDQGTLTISGNGKLESAFFEHEYEVKKVVIEPGVTSIGDEAFYYFYNLKEIEIPEGVKEIGERAFMYCDFESVTIPASVTKIGNNAFSACDSLKGIWVKEENKNYSSDNNGVLYDKNKNTVIRVPSLIEGDYTLPSSITKIGESAFYSCKSLKEIEILEGVKEIGNEAFRNCYALEKVTIPGSVTKIGDEAFDSCESLKEIEIPEGVKEIGKQAFEYCDALEKVTISGSVTKIGNNAFRDCYSLKEIEISEGVKEIGNQTFRDCAELESVIIPSSVTKIGNNAFRDCDSLEEIEISEGVKEIGKQAFRGCDILEKVAIPGSVTKIGDEAFYSCESLKEIEISEGVKEIGNEAFKDCYALEKVAIPGSVTKIGDGAFYDCESLKEIEILEGVKEIGESAFIFCDFESVTIPGSITKIGDEAFGYCDELKAIWVDKKNNYYSSDKNGVLYNKNKTTIIQRPVGQEGSFTIPASVTSIGESAFSRNALKNIVIPSGVKNIGNYAFAGCYLESVTIKEGVTSIGEGAFQYCDIEEIIIPNSVTEIGAYAFQYCEDLESVTIGRNIEKIGECIFELDPEGGDIDDGVDPDDLISHDLEVKFLGKAPKFAGTWDSRDTFIGVKCYYPKNNSSWTKSNAMNSKYSIWEGYEGTRYAPTIKASNVASSGKIKLTWGHANGAAKYKVYRATSKNGTYKLLGTTKGTTFTNTSATTGKTYYYYIKAVDSKGKNAKKSNVVSRTCDLARPKVTVKLNSKGKPKLTWKKVSHASKYEVYRSTSQDGKYKLIKTTKGTSLTNGSAKSRTKYFYKVKAIYKKSSANSAYSTVVSIKSK